MMTPERTIMAIFSILYLALAVFVFYYYHLSSVFHQGSIYCIALASGLLVSILLQIVLLLFEPKSRFVSSDKLRKGLLWLGVIILFLLFLVDPKLFQ
jgi:hypothetical protein